MPDLGPILANLVSMDFESPRGFDERERFKAFRLHLRPSRRLILSFLPPSSSSSSSFFLLSPLLVESLSHRI